MALIRSKGGVVLNKYLVARVFAFDDHASEARAACVAKGSFSDQAGHFGSSWPGGGERPPIRYEDSWGGLRGPSDTQLLIYSYIKR